MAAMSFIFEKCNICVCYIPRIDYDLAECDNDVRSIPCLGWMNFQCGAIRYAMVWCGVVCLCVYLYCTFGTPIEQSKIEFYENPTNSLTTYYYYYCCLAKFTLFRWFFEFFYSSIHTHTHTYIPVPTRVKCNGLSTVWHHRTLFASIMNEKYEWISHSKIYVHKTTKLLPK